MILKKIEPDFYIFYFNTTEVSIEEASIYFQEIKKMFPKDTKIIPMPQWASLIRMNKKELKQICYFLLKYIYEEEKK